MDQPRSCSSSASPRPRSKILVTLGLLLAYRVGFQIPIPGMDARVPEPGRGGRRAQIFGVMNAFSGGAIGQTAIFSLGIMPYISASIIFSMLAKVSPTIEAVAEGGRQRAEEDQPVDASGDRADRARAVDRSSTPACSCATRR